MDGAPPVHRHEMVNRRSGYVVVEHEVHSRAMRSYFTPEAVPPVEEYREGPQIWKFSGTAQTLQFDIRDTETGEVVSFGELLGLVYYSCVPAGERHLRLGELAQEQRISALRRGDAPAVRGVAARFLVDKLRVLNALQRAAEHAEQEDPDSAGLLRAAPRVQQARS